MESDVVLHITLTLGCAHAQALHAALTAILDPQIGLAHQRRTVQPALLY